MAAFFVIFNHTGDRGFFLFSLYPKHTPQFWIYLFISIFCKFSVPMFFAISGALLLANEKEPIQVVWKKRIVRIFFILLFFSFLYYLQRVYQGSEMFNFSQFMLEFYKSDWNYSYWYLYSFLAFLISLPLLRVFVHGMENKHYCYIIGLAIFFNGILPIVEYLLWKDQYFLNGNLRVGWVTGNFVLYSCIGYFLEHKLDSKKMQRYIPALWGLNFFCIGICCYMTYYKSIITGECSEGASQAFHNSFVLINCITLYITIKCLFQSFSPNKTLEMVIRSMGKSTFGIYLFHIAIMHTWIVPLWDILRVEWKLNYMLSAFVYCFAVMAIGYFIMLAFKLVTALSVFVFSKNKPNLLNIVGEWLKK